MANQKNKIGLEKNIYLSDIHDESYFNEIIGEGKYIIFDKHEIIKQVKTRKIDRNVLNYISNVEIAKAITKAIRNKKIKSIVYLLYTTKPKLIIKNINTIVIPKLNTSIDIKFSMITTHIDSKIYQYKDKDYENIHIRPDEFNK